MVPRADGLNLIVFTGPTGDHNDRGMAGASIVGRELPGGLSLDDLAAVAERLGRNEIIGVEVAEFEEPADSTDETDYAGPLVDALSPMLASRRSQPLS